MFVRGAKRWCGFNGKGQKAINISIYCWLHKNVPKISSYTGINRDTLLVSYYWGLNSSLSLLDTIWHRGIGTETWHIILQKCSVFTVGCTRMY